MDHAKLSPSSSSRWMNCPGSVEAEAAYPNLTTKAADQGTLAHHLAERCLLRPNLNIEDIDVKFFYKAELHETFDQDMVEFVNIYINYVRDYLSKATIYAVEERLDCSHIIAGGFGTSDAWTFNSKTGVLDVFDLKYGISSKISAKNNPQLMIYGSALHHSLKDKVDVKFITLHIIQPRLNNINWVELSVKDILEFNKEVKVSADEALLINAPRVPGELQCKWCRAKADCTALYDFTKGVIIKDFDQISDLDSAKVTDFQKKKILDHKKEIEGFMNSIEASILNRLESGGTFEGYKLGISKTQLKWGESAEAELTKKLGEGAFESKLIGITNARKVLNEEEINELTYRPSGRTILIRS